MMSPKTRKPVCDLSLGDFDQCPVWEFALDEEGEEGQDEATVRPYLKDEPVDASSGMFVVRARFLLADGTRLFGYHSLPVHGDSTLSTLQPIIVTHGGQVPFWCGVLVPENARIAESYRRLAKSAPEQVFPLTFESDVPVLGGSISGRLDGFMVLEDFRTGKFRVLT